MIKTNSDCLEQETVQKYAYAIRHFRGYLDKEKFDDDLAFLVNFVHEVGGCQRGKSGHVHHCETCSHS